MQLSAKTLARQPDIVDQEDTLPFCAFPKGFAERLRFQNRRLVRFLSRLRGIVRFLWGLRRIAGGGLVGRVAEFDHGVTLADAAAAGANFCSSMALTPG